MDTVLNDEFLGNDLVFFAHHPQEMDEFYGEPSENFKHLFKSLDVNQFAEMNRLVSKIGDSAAEEAREITLEVRDRLKNFEFVSVEPIKLSSYWESGLRIRKKNSKKVTCNNIECRAIIETDEGSLFARTWIWANGVNRNTLSEVLSSSVGLPPSPPKDYDSYSLVVASVNLREAATQRRTKEWLYRELTSPLLNIQKSEWDEIIKLAAK